MILRLRELGNTGYEGGHVTQTQDDSLWFQPRRTLPACLCLNTSGHGSLCSFCSRSQACVGWFLNHDRAEDTSMDEATHSAGD